MLLSQFIREGSRRLEALYPPQEARSLMMRLVQDIGGFMPFDYIVRPDLEAPPVLAEALERLLGGEPLQYVTSFQEFYGRRFSVRPGVLIPRPETELLVREACLRALQMEAPRVLDLCTGSGCIAWSIALEVPGAHVTAVDISEEALEVARDQKQCSLIPEDGKNGISGLSKPFFDPEFVLSDVLQEQEFPGAPFDIIVANPPYIRESEKAQMHPNVLEHEPALALFVPDEDPLVFYRAIAAHAVRSMVPGGWGIAEINEALGKETAAVFEAAGLGKVEILRDYFGRDRFVTFTR